MVGFDEAGHFCCCRSALNQTPLYPTLPFAHVTMTCPGRKRPYPNCPSSSKVNSIQPGFQKHFCPLEDCKGIGEAGPDKHIHIIPDELAALTYAIQNAQDATMIVQLSDRINRSVQLIREFKELEEKYELHPDLLVRA